MPPLGDKDCLKPISQRRLQAPQMHYIPKLSLPQVLVHHAEARTKTSVVPGAPENATSRPPIKNMKTGHLKRRTTLVQPAQNPSFQASNEDAEWPAVGGGLGALRQVEEMFNTGSQLSDSTGLFRRSFATSAWSGSGREQHNNESSHFVSRRRAHPRLRWPRLASRGNDRGTDPALTTESTGIKKTHEVQDEGGLSEEGQAKLIPCSRDLVLGLHTGGSEQSMSSSLRAKAPLRPAILPRVSPREAIRPGTASTFHAPLGDDFESETLDFNYESQTSLFSLDSSATGFSQAWSVGGSSSSTSQHVDRKWFMRMTPISCLPAEPTLMAARRALADQSGKERGESGEYLSFQRWGINDDYIESLLAAHSAATGGLQGVQHMNLSENLLTEVGVAKLAGHSVPESLLSLNLSANRFGANGGPVLGEVIGQCRHLSQLDVSGNALGDIIAEELVVVIERSCPEIKGLGLAGCGLGASPRIGTALGTLLNSALQLESLDLYWNQFHGQGAHHFLQGLYDNGVQLGGQLRRVNLAWNRLGSGNSTSEARRQDALRSAKLFGSIFHDGSVLFHLDISYNGFDVEACAILAQGLKLNHTLFGIHLIGNEAAVDDLGFVIPIDRSCQRSGKKPTGFALAGAEDEVEDATGKALVLHPVEGEQHVERINGFVRGVPAKLRMEHPSDLDPPDARAGWPSIPPGEEAAGRTRRNPSLRGLAGDGAASFSEQDLQAEQRWVENRSRVQPLGKFLSNDFEALQRNTKCCWICENWVEHKVAFTPGVSSRNADNVESVSVLYSIDGFTRPTTLSKQDQVVQRPAGRRTIFQLPEDICSAFLSPGGAEGETKVQQIINRRMSRRVSRSPRSGGLGNLMVTRWVGSRMLPPTTLPLEIIFIVNGCVTVANDLPSKKLDLPKIITLPGARGDGSKVMDSKTIVEVTDVNLAPAGVSLWENQKNGMAAALCILEDPNNRTEFTVMPRVLLEASVKPKSETTWQFESSSFKEFKRDNEAEVHRCFDADWNNSRLPLLIKDENARKEFCQHMRANYLPLMLSFRVCAFEGYDVKGHAAGVCFNAFRENLIHSGGEGPGKLIDGRACKLNDPDCIFIAANVIDRNKRKEFKVLPDKGLGRFQYLEAVVRLAFRRFITSSSSKGDGETCKGAMIELMSMCRLGEDALRLREEFHKALFTEECDMVYKENMELLKTVYESYKHFCRYPGRGGKMLSYGAWMEMLNDSGVVSEDFPLRNIGLAFAMGKEIRADVTSDWTCMELSWGEFLVALGAVATLRAGYDREFIADLLEELFIDHMLVAKNQVVNKKPGKSTLKGPGDASMGPLVSFLGRMFQDADDDGSGTVDQRQFRRVFSQPSYKAEMGRLGVHVGELDVLFRMCDKDGTGEVTLDVFIECFMKLKLSMKGIERAISYIRKAFAEADEDKSGTLDILEFHNLFEQPNVLKKLTSLGVSVEDLDDLFNLIDKSGNGEITLEEIIEGFVQLRDPRNAGLRGVRLLEKYFEDAELDDDDELSKEGLLEAFGNEEVSEKLRALSMKPPDWETMFEELDIDGSGGLSWEEISDGMSAYWAKDKLDAM